MVGWIWTATPTFSQLVRPTSFDGSVPSTPGMESMGRGSESVEMILAQMSTEPNHATKDNTFPMYRPVCLPMPSPFKRGPVASIRGEKRPSVDDVDDDSKRLRNNPLYVEM